MNTAAILTAIIALLTGLATGVVITNDKTEQSIPPTNSQTTESTIEAGDFVSIRPALAELPQSEVTELEQKDLIYMREEEKLARDVYQTLYEKWGLGIFSNIAQSEQTHTEAIRDILSKYSIKDPVNNDAVGKFTNQDLQSLYNSLVESGLKSETDALKIGATIEDLDLKDLDEAISRTDNDDIKLVYENLTRGSRNHLRAFTKQLTARDVTYQPQYISSETYNSIINTGTEAGKNNQKGNGRGWGG